MKNEKSIINKINNKNKKNRSKYWQMKNKQIYY